MPPVRTGAQRIWSGDPKVMRKAPLARPTRRARQEEPQEIAFLAEAKKLEEAKKEAEPTGLTRAVQEIKDSGVKGAEAGYQLNKALNDIYGDEIKRVRTTARREAQSEYRRQAIQQKPSFEELRELQAKYGGAGQAAAEEFTEQVVSTLPPALRTWYNKQVDEYREVMAEAHAEYKAELEKVKDKYGDDPRRYTDERLKLKAKIFPTWSFEAKGAQEKFKERQDTLAKAVAAAKKAGVKDLSTDEIYALATSTPQTSQKWATELGLSSEQVASIRGEKFEPQADVAGIGIVPEMVEQPITVIEATQEELQRIENAKAKGQCEGAMKAYYTIKIYKVTLKDGTVVLVEALDESTAEQKATDAGYDPAWVTRKMGWETVEAPSKPTGAYNVTLEDGTQVTMVPFKDAESGESYLIPKDAASELQATDAYKNASGSTQERLGIALASTQEEFRTWVANLQEQHPDLYAVYEDQGAAGLDRAIEQRQGILAELKDYKEGEGYNLSEALADKTVTQDDLALVGFKKSDIEQAAEAAQPILDLDKEFQALPREKQSWYIKEHNAFAQYCPDKDTIPDKPYSELTDEQRQQLLTEWYAYTRPEYFRERAKATGKVALAFVPVAGTVAYWNEMSPAMRAISIAGDILVVGFVAHAATAGARAARGYTAAARMRAAAKGAGQAVIAEVTAPAEMLAHPIQTTKGIGRQVQSAIETLVHPGKIPLGSTELTYTTARLPVSDVGGAKKAMQLRDAAVTAAIQGRHTRATVGDVTLQLTPAELQKVGGAVGVHATPDVRPYLNGAMVKGGAEGSGVFISPNFHSRFAQATAFGDVPEGGIKGGLIIRDKRILNALAPSGKTYMSTAEIEALLKPGTTIPAPSQILFTRDLAGNKLTFLVIGDPFTKAQIARLKFMGSIDTLGQVFKPTMRLTGSQKAAINAMDDIIALADERAKLARQLEAARAAGRSGTVREVTQQIANLDERIAKLTERVNAPREVIRPTDLTWAEYAEKGVLERYEQLSQRKPQRTSRGRRLPDIRPALALRAAPAVLRDRLEATKDKPYISVKYKKGETPPYTPSKAPAYVPVETPPYVPAKPPITPSLIPPAYPPGRTPPTRRPPAKPPPTGKRSRVRFGPPPKPRRDKLPRQDEGLISWRQGAYWITLVEPYRTTGTKPDVLYSKERPPWAKKVKGKRSPQKTLQAIGRGHPKSIKLPMGVVMAHVKGGRKLRFLSN